MEDKFANGMLSVIKNNPELMCWFLQNEPNEELILELKGWADVVQVCLFDCSILIKALIIVDCQEYNSNIDVDQ